MIRVLITLLLLAALTSNGIRLPLCKISSTTSVYEDSPTETAEVMIIIRVPILVAASHECGIRERVVLENTTDVPVWHMFTEGSHGGFVIVEPGQTVTVDVVRCE